MKDLYVNLYKVIYITFHKSWPMDDPEWKAALLLPVMILFDLILAYEILMAFHLLTSNFVVIYFVFGIYGGLFLLNCFMFIKTKRYVEFRDEFNSLDKDSQQKKYKIGILICVFGYLTPIALFVLIFSLGT